MQCRYLTETCHRVQWQQQVALVVALLGQRGGPPAGRVSVHVTAVPALPAAVHGGLLPAAVHPEAGELYLLDHLGLFAAASPSGRPFSILLSDILGPGWVAHLTTQSFSRTLSLPSPPPAVFWWSLGTVQSCQALTVMPEASP